MLSAMYRTHSMLQINGGGQEWPAGKLEGIRCVCF